MNFETMFQLNPHIWPLAVMCFIRISIVLLWLPVFSDKNVPGRVRILLSLMLAIFLWPTIENTIAATPVFMQWSPFSLSIAILREAFFGFALGFSARMLQNAAAIGSHIVGLNMGFQTATLFSEAVGAQESAFTAIHSMLIILLILTFNLHHFFIEGIAKSFLTVPLAPGAFNPGIFKLAINILMESFVLALRICAPLMVVQILVSIAMGCLARAMPQLNVFVLNFPVSFILSFIVLFAGASTLIHFLSTSGLNRQAGVFSQMLGAFVPAQKGGSTP